MLQLFPFDDMDQQTNKQIETRSEKGHIIPERGHHDDMLMKYAAWLASFSGEKGWIHHSLLLDVYIHFSLSLLSMDGNIITTTTTTRCLLASSLSLYPLFN